MYYVRKNAYRNYKSFTIQCICYIYADTLTTSIAVHTSAHIQWHGAFRRMTYSLKLFCGKTFFIMLLLHTHTKQTLQKCAICDCLSELMPCISIIPSIPSRASTLSHIQTQILSHHKYHSHWICVMWQNNHIAECLVSYKCWWLVSCKCWCTTVA